MHTLHVNKANQLFDLPAIKYLELLDKILQWKWTVGKILSLRIHCSYEYTPVMVVILAKVVCPKDQPGTNRQVEHSLYEEMPFDSLRPLQKDNF